MFAHKSRTLIPFQNLGWRSMKERGSTLDLMTSLMVHWLRIHLPMQGTWVWLLVWEDSTCPRATKPMPHNYCTYMLQLLKPKHPETCAPQQQKPPQWDALAPQLEKACVQQRRPSTAKKAKNTKIDFPGFPGGSAVKNQPTNTGDMGSVPDPERSHMPRSD